MRLLRRVRSFFLMMGLGAAVIHPLAAEIQEYVPTRHLALQRYVDMQRFQVQTPPDRVVVSRFRETAEPGMYDVWLLVNQKEQDKPVRVRLQESAFGYKAVLTRVDLKWQLLHTQKTPWT